MHERAPVHLADLVFGQSREPADTDREVGDPTGVLERVGTTTLQLRDHERRLTAAVAVECLRVPSLHRVLDLRDASALMRARGTVPVSRSSSLNVRSSFGAGLTENLSRAQLE